MNVKNNSHTMYEILKKKKNLKKTKSKRSREMLRTLSSTLGEDQGSVLNTHIVAPSNPVPCSGL